MIRLVRIAEYPLSFELDAAEMAAPVGDGLLLVQRLVSPVVARSAPVLVLQFDPADLLLAP